MSSQKYFIKVGDVYGRLTVLSKANDPRAGTFWRCRCECGNEVTVLQRKLGNGHTQSCGCYHRDRARESNVTHGMADHRLYSIWCNMKTRCTWEAKPDYKHYGGRGITYDPSFETFEGFLAGIPEGYAPRLELDRIDNDRGYEPGNLRWATRREQMRHTRTTGKVTHPITGKLCTYREIAEEYNINVGTLNTRVWQGMSISEAVENFARRKVEVDEALEDEIWHALGTMSITDVSRWYNVPIGVVRDIRDGVKRKFRLR